MYFAYQTCTTKLRFSSWSCGSVLRTTKLRFSSWSCGSVFRVLDLYYKVAIFELETRKCTSRTRLVLQAGCAKVRKHGKTIRSPPKTTTFKKVLGPSKVFRPLLLYIYMYVCIHNVCVRMFFFIFLLDVATSAMLDPKDLKQLATSEVLTWVWLPLFWVAAHTTFAAVRSPLRIHDLLGCHR